MQSTIVFVFFDVPTKEKEERRKYYKFRKLLIKSEYIMFQESIYYKYLRNVKMLVYEVNKLDRFNISGDIKIINISERDFNQIKILKGKKNDLSLYRNALHF